MSMLDANTDRTLFTIGAVIIAGVLFIILTFLINGDEGLWSQTKGTVNELFADTEADIEGLGARSDIVDPEHDWRN